jgi:pyrimidine-specific ribonucleoside hydrolase
LIAIKGYNPFYELHKGKIIVAADGSNTWDDKGTGQAYLVEKADYKTVQSLINKLIISR